MSFEGYYQKLCEKGHLTCVDVYGPEDDKCNCGKKFVWENTVDQTNGENDGLVNLEIISQESCDCCGHVKETVYKIPDLERGA